MHFVSSEFIGYSVSNHCLKMDMSLGQFCNLRSPTSTTTRNPCHNNPDFFIPTKIVHPHPVHCITTHSVAVHIMKPISDEVRNNIVSLLDSGLSGRQISARLNVGRSTVNRVRAATRHETEKPRAGRPAKLSVADKRRLVRTITSGKADNPVQVARELKHTVGVETSAQTVRRALKEVGLKAATKKRKPRLLPRHIRGRMDFALRHQHWTVEDWKQVVWSDETKINRLGSDGCKWVWRRSGDGLTARDVQGTVKFGGGSLMLWGCMTAEGVGYSCRIDGRMDAELYTRILGDEFIRTLEYYGMDKGKILFQQDNDPKHTSQAARRWFEENGIQVLDWPPQSPDLNPIEHLWAHLKRRLAEYDTEPSGMIELWERVQVEWNKIPQQVCMDLIESMPRRIAAVLKAKGGNTKY
jgi:transposase